MYDKDNVKITATNLEYGEEAANLKLKIENNSKKKLTFSAGTMGYGVNAINGFMVSGGYLNCEADAGESIDEEMSFDYEELILLGMKEIADIRVGFTISDEDFNNIYTKPVQIKSKKFAAGCSRDVINTGAERLGWPIEELMEKTILAMRSCEDAVNEAVSAL